MARYRQKDETDLIWNRIRRRITREFDTQIMDWREEALNTLLSTAWTRYVKSIEADTVLELETEYESFVGTALNEIIPAFAAVIDKAA